MPTPPARWLRGAVVGPALLVAALLAAAVGHRSPEAPARVPPEPEVLVFGCGLPAGQHRFWEDFPEVEPPPLHLRVWATARRSFPTGVLLGLLAGTALPGLVLGIGALRRAEDLREWRRARDG